MKPKALIAFVGLLLLLTIGLGSATTVRHEASRKFEFIYSASLKNLPPGSHNVRVWIPIAATDPRQTVILENVQSTVPKRMTREPVYGNHMLYAEFSASAGTPPGFKLVYVVTRREYSKGDFKSLMKFNSDPAPLPRFVQRFLLPDRLVPVGGRLQEIAQRATRGQSGEIEKAHALYDYVFHNMRYDKSGTGWGRGDALWACDSKHGNCTDFHSLFISLARSENIPARFEIGFPLPDDLHEGMVPGYHCWAEFYAPGAGWVPVDISEAWLDQKKYDVFFGTLDANRVRFSRGRDLTLAPKQSGPPLNYFVYPYVEVDGKPFQATSRFRFKDLER